MRGKTGLGISVGVLVTLVLLALGLTLAVVRRQEGRTAAASLAVARAECEAGRATRAREDVNVSRSAVVSERASFVGRKAAGAELVAGATAAGVAPAEDATAREAGAGTEAAQSVASAPTKPAISPDWAKLARAQMTRPTDFAKLTEELKRKQALAAGLDEAAVRAELEKRALTGDADAALTLGLMLCYGAGATDKAQAEKLITAAAESGNARAMAELGRILLADETCARGSAQAESWLRKAWAVGESEGAFLLASAQRLGMLEAATDEDSTALLLAAAEAGNDASRRLLTLLRKEIEGLDRAQLDRWMTELAETGDVGAMMQMATLKREDGQYAATISWLERAAAAGSTDAIMTLATLAGRGDAGAEARASAIIHLREQLAAPDTASPRAKYALAALLVLETDRVVEQQAEALALLREAGKDGIYRAAIAAMLIEDGSEGRAAIGAVMKMDDAAVYVRYVELRRAKGDKKYTADGAPTLIATVPPIYPVELRASGISGAVTVRFQVRADGTVGDCEILKSDHPALSAAAVEAVQQWQFQPGIKHGKPAAAQIRITFPFRLSK